MTTPGSFRLESLTGYANCADAPPRSAAPTSLSRDLEFSRGSARLLDWHWSNRTASIWPVITLAQASLNWNDDSRNTLLTDSKIRVRHLLWQVAYLLLPWDESACSIYTKRNDRFGESRRDPNEDNNPLRSFTQDDIPGVTFFCSTSSNKPCPLFSYTHEVSSAATRIYRDTVSTSTTTTTSILAPNTLKSSTCKRYRTAHTIMTKRAVYPFVEKIVLEFRKFPFLSPLRLVVTARFFLSGAKPPEEGCVFYWKKIFLHALLVLSKRSVHTDTHTTIDKRREISSS